MTFIKERYITVTDNWYPCYEGNKVRVELSLTPFLNKYYVSLVAWGADDTAYTKDFEYATEAEAKWQYNELISTYNIIPNGINKDWFIDHGFRRF